MRAVLLAAAAVELSSPAPAETRYCHQWREMLICEGPGGYRSYEQPVFGRPDLTAGADNLGNRWWEQDDGRGGAIVSGPVQPRR
jgi:hypothetical protein